MPAFHHVTYKVKGNAKLLRAAQNKPSIRVPKPIRNSHCAMLSGKRNHKAQTAVRGGGFKVAATMEFSMAGIEKWWVVVVVMVVEGV